ncbi:MAG: response regulator [bacterium]
MDTPSVDNRKRVLLVDDMRINLMVLAAKLKKLNYRCEVAHSGAHALEIIPVFKPDIVMTDLWMPDMNGDELALKVRAMSDYNQLPIFVVTADFDNPIGFDRTVFSGILQKPIDDVHLQELLSSASPPSQ